MDLGHNLEGEKDEKSFSELWNNKLDFSIECL